MAEIKENSSPKPNHITSSENSCPIKKTQTVTSNIHLKDQNSLHNPKGKKNDFFLVEIDYYKPILSHTFEQLYDKFYRLFCRLIGKGRIKKFYRLY